jgi:hypothetical protein
MTFAYKCKFCGELGAATCDDECPGINIEKWLPLLCCNRCGDYQQWLNRATHVVKKMCYDWAALGPKKRAEKQNDLFVKLTETTQRIATKVCAFHRIPYEWDRDFVDQLMEKPDKAEFIVRLFNTVAFRKAGK